MATRTADPSADWRKHAACAGQDTALWFPTNGQSATAKQICGRCPVRAECLYDALKTEPSYGRYGMWGGLTGQQRHDLPALPMPRAVALAALREVFDRLPDPDFDPQPDRTDQPMPTAPVPNQAAPVVDVQLKDSADVRLKPVTDNDPARLPVGKLLAWGDQHADPEIQDQAARARAALAGLRQRYTADRELSAITSEAKQLEERLAALRAREAELAPKPRKKRGSYVRDYDTRTVRAWAEANGVDCPRKGQIPKRVLDAWRAAQAA